jgi:hypothetical protein
MKTRSNSQPKSKTPEQKKAEPDPAENNKPAPEQPPAQEEAVRRWPVPLPVLQEMIDVNGQIAEAQEAVRIAQEELNGRHLEMQRLRRIAAQLSGAPGDAQLLNLYVGFTEPETPMEQIDVLAEQLRPLIEQEARRQLAERWMEQTGDKE